MNSQESYKDILDEYVKSAGNEMAPEGFTQKVMQHVYLEKHAYKPLIKKRNYVPLITSVVVGVLVSASLVIPVKTPEIIDRFRSSINIKLEFPDLNNLIILPKTVMYVVVGMVVLTCFDVLLRVVFHRKKL
jgi:uncharacterized BrkB/YihY/UPF0761 family membrane protein